MSGGRGALGASLGWLLLLAVGCVGEDDVDNDRGSSADGGADASRADASGGGGGRDDASRSDASALGDAAPAGDSAAAVTCRSWTEPSGGMCGGAHCNQTYADLKASAQTGATCGSEVDLMTLCSLRGPNVLGQCAQQSSGNRQATATCAQAQLGSSLSSGCLECYLRSLDCTLLNCLNDCLNGTNTERCDTCRANRGCAGEFFTCAGLATPPQKL